MTLTYKKKLFLYFFGVFLLFTVAIILMQHTREQRYKVETLQSTLSAYTGIVDNYLNELKGKNHNDKEQCDYNTVGRLFPIGLRITIVDEKGEVVYDNNREGYRITENHLSRPEIRKAQINGTGTAIRKSDSLGGEYYYMATEKDGYFIRVAMPYDIRVKGLLKADNLYIYFILALFIVVFFSLLFISDKFGRALSALRDFAYVVNKNPQQKKILFPHGELGEIGVKLVDNYNEINHQKEEIRKEKEKLLLHFSHSSEGIAFFSSEHNAIYSNARFITFLNTIIDEPTTEPEMFFVNTYFHKAINFIMENRDGCSVPFEDKINRNGQFFTLRVFVFEDKTIEVILNNITSSEKNRILKQQMTNNIAHELRTPVSSIRGYMETLLNQGNIAPDKMKHFIERSYMQVVRLSDLIRDISIITKIEEAQEQIVKTKLSVNEEINKAIEQLDEKIKTMNATVNNGLQNDVVINGNQTLVFSIFSNIIDNGLNYAGEDVIINIRCYMEDDNYYYFSVSDNGKGIAEEHLTKIFDRFYRTNDGRSRQSGGSGLGLSIVKNSILFHNGTVSAKNRKEGGLEILFSLGKN